MVGISNNAHVIQVLYYIPPSWLDLKAKILEAIKNDEQPKIFEELLAEVCNFMTHLISSE